MKLLYVSCFPKDYFSEIEKKAINTTSLPSQKFNRLLMEGFLKNNIDVEVLVTFDQIAKNNKVYTDQISMFQEGATTYYFLPFFKKKNRENNCRILKKFANEWEMKNPNGVVFIDVLKPYVDYIYRYFRKSRLITVVTDLPSDLNRKDGFLNKIKSLLKEHLFRLNIRKSTSFVFLTSAMNTKLNKHGKPF